MKPSYELKPLNNENNYKKTDCTVLDPLYGILFCLTDKAVLYNFAVLLSIGTSNLIDIIRCE